MKSFTAAHPFAGCASTPVDVHRYVDGRAHVPPAGGGVVGVDVPDRPVHFWLLPPLQAQICTRVPAVVSTATVSACTRRAHGFGGRGLADRYGPGYGPAGALPPPARTAVPNRQASMSR